MTLALPASVTLDNVEAVLELLQQALAEGDAGPLVVDASALKELDSSAISLLLHARRLAGARGVVVRALPHKLGVLAKLYGVEPLLPAPA